MESVSDAHEGSGLAVPSPPSLDRPAQAPLDREPDDLVPLRLVLQPSGISVEVNRRDVVVGRHSEADVRLPLPDVSRRHCRLQFVEGCWQVIDLNSLNGVFLNGEQVLQAPLEDGDELRVGGFTFLVELPPEEQADPVRSILEMLSPPLSQPFPQRKAS
jgi:pSer/pThr/pTyr-binding forkhead associated (FHA) protein